MKRRTTTEISGIAIQLLQLKSKYLGTGTSTCTVRLRVCTVQYRNEIYMQIWHTHFSADG